MTHTLTLAENMFLLSRKNDSGAEQGHFVEYALAGCVVADLTLRGFLVPNPEKPKRLLVQNPDARTGIPYLDDAFNMFAEKMDGKTAESYVNKLANKKSVLSGIGASLVEKGILEKVPKSFLGIKWMYYPESDPSPEKALIAHLEQVMFEGEAPSAEDCVLVALMKSTELLNRNFDKAQLKANKARIKALAEAEAEMTVGAKKAIEAVQAAVLVAAIVPAIAAT